MIGHPPVTLDKSPKIRGPYLRSTPSATGSWQTYASNDGRRLLWIGILFSVGFHVVVLYGFNRHAKVVKITAADDTPAVQLVMPDLKELDDPDPQPTDDPQEVDAGLTVPMLADVPTQVDLSSFVQEIDYSSLTPKQDLSAAKALTIPTHISHGGKIGGNLGKIFDLKDLDHNPEPTLQIKPVFPPTLKQAGMEALVTVGFIVTASGDVANPYIMNSTDHRFDDAALIAVSKWKFRAGMKNGRRVNVRVAQPIPFRVTDDS